MAEYMSHKHTVQTVPEDDVLLFTISSSYKSPLMIVSIVLSTVALAFTIFIGIKLKALSILFLNARTVSAVPTKLNFFHTTPALIMPNVYRTPATEYVNRLYLHLAVLLFIILLLIGLGYFYFMPKYYKYKYNREPHCEINLQLKFLSAQIYTYVMKLDSHIVCHMFMAKDSLKSVRVEGTLFPRLHMEWPSLTIKNIMLDENAKWLRSIKLSYKQASILRKALPASTNPPVPMLYFYRVGHTGPSPVQFYDPPIGDNAENPTEPSAPDSTTSFTLTRLYRLYPTVHP